MSDTLEEYLNVQNPYCRILYDTVIRLKARTVLEFGVGEGFSTVALLAGVKETKGVLWSVDIRIFEPGMNRIKSTPFLDTQRWHFILLDDCEWVTIWSQSIDLLYIDSNHQYEHTLKELELFAPYVKPDGVILLHDTLLTGMWDGAPARVKDAIDTFTQKNQEWVFEELLPHDPGHCGVGKLERSSL